MMTPWVQDEKVKQLPTTVSASVAALPHVSGQGSCCNCSRQLPSKEAHAAVSRRQEVPHASRRVMGQANLTGSSGPRPPCP